MYVLFMLSYTLTQPNFNLLSQNTSDSNDRHQVHFQEALHCYFYGLPPPVLCYLDGGDKSSSDVRTEAGRHGQLGNIFFFLHRCSDGLLAE